MDTIDKKIKELLSKEYSMDVWDCRNDEPNSEEWMLIQKIENSLIVVEETLKATVSRKTWIKVGILPKEEQTTEFWRKVRKKLKQKLVEINTSTEKN